MYAHDRTMLAKLGFADPDKRNPRHDLACQYLALPDVSGRVARLLGLERPPAPCREQDERTEENCTESTSIGGCGVTFEHQIVKGSGQYCTTIGFVDLVYCVELLTSRTERVLRRRPDTSARWGWPESLADYQCARRVNVGIEVKIAPVGIGDLLRQIKLYRTYTDNWTPQCDGLSGDIARWIVATGYPLTALEIQSLTNERIAHVLLGEAFRTFVESQAAVDAAGNVEV